MTFNCPNCSGHIEVNDDAAQVEFECPHCAAMISTPVLTDFEDPSQGTIHQENASKRCPYCAETIRREAIKCRYCGADLVPSITQPRTAAKPVGKLLVFVLTPLCLLAVVFFGMPFITLKQIQGAIDRSDGDSLSRHVDFPKLRENLKHQLTIRWMQEMGKNATENDFGSAGLAIGMALGGTLMDRILDTVVSPTGLGKIFEYRKLEIQSLTRTEVSTNSPSKSAFEDARYAFRGLSEFAVAVPTGKSAEHVEYVFTRTWMSWRLTNIKLPLTDSLLSDAPGAVPNPIEIIEWDVSFKDARSTGSVHANWKFYLRNRSERPRVGQLWLYGYDKDGFECYQNAYQIVTTIPPGGELKKIEEAFFEPGVYEKIDKFKTVWK